MSRTTLAGARTELKALLDTVTGVEVLDHEPHAVNAQTNPVVTIFCDGYNTGDWRFTIRVYSNAATDRDAQIQLDTILPAIEHALNSSWGPISWDIGFLEPLDKVIASLPIVAGREDI